MSSSFCIMHPDDFRRIAGGSPSPGGQPVQVMVTPLDDEAKASVSALSPDQLGAMGLECVSGAPDAGLSLRISAPPPASRAARRSAAPLSGLRKGFLNPKSGQLPSPAPRPSISALASEGLSPALPLSVLAYGEADLLCRPCVTCGRNTGSFCDGRWIPSTGLLRPCLAARWIPMETWADGQSTPLCSECDRRDGLCRFCLALPGCTPPKHNFSGNDNSRLTEQQLRGLGLEISSRPTEWRDLKFDTHPAHPAGASNDLPTASVCPSAMEGYPYPTRTPGQELKCSDCGCTYIYSGCTAPCECGQFQCPKCYDANSLYCLQCKPAHAPRGLPSSLGNAPAVVKHTMENKGDDAMSVDSEVLPLTSKATKAGLFSGLHKGFLNNANASVGHSSAGPRVASPPLTGGLPHCTTSALQRRSAWRCEQLDIYFESLPGHNRVFIAALYDNTRVGAWEQVSPLLRDLHAAHQAVDHENPGLKSWCLLTKLAIKAWLYYHLDDIDCNHMLTTRLRTRFFWSTWHVLSRAGSWTPWPVMSNSDKILMADSLAMAILEGEQLDPHYLGVRFGID